MALFLTKKKKAENAQREQAKAAEDDERMFLRGQIAEIRSKPFQFDVPRVLDGNIRALRKERDDIVLTRSVAEHNERVSLCLKNAEIRNNSTHFNHIPPAPYGNIQALRQEHNALEIALAEHEERERDSVVISQRYGVTSTSTTSRRLLMKISELSGRSTTLVLTRAVAQKSQKLCVQEGADQQNDFEIEETKIRADTKRQKIQSQADVEVQKTSIQAMVMCFCVAGACFMGSPLVTVAAIIGAVIVFSGNAYTAAQIKHSDNARRVAEMQGALTYGRQQQQIEAPYPTKKTAYTVEEI